jgi:hypothetical protein
VEILPPEGTMPTVSEAASRTATIRRISEGRRHWRVSVQSWQERGTVRGCLLFETETAAIVDRRSSAAMLQGPSHEDVLLLAHDLPEDRLRRVLHSLS